VIPRERVSEIIKTLGQSGERGEAALLQAGRELRARWKVSGAAAHDQSSSRQAKARAS